MGAGLMMGDAAITKEDDWTYRFVCVQCDREITHLGPEPPKPVCALCAWLDEFIADPQERATLRERYAI